MDNFGNYRARILFGHRGPGETAEQLGADYDDETIDELLRGVQG